MDCKNVKKLQWICCDNGTYIDDQKITKCYELVATDLNNNQNQVPYNLTEIYVMRILSDHLPLTDFPASDLFGRKLVWFCNLDLFETRQAMVYENDIHKGGMTDVYFPKQRVKLTDIFQFDVE